MYLRLIETGPQPKRFFCSKGKYQSKYLTPGGPRLVEVASNAFTRGPASISPRPWQLVGSPVPFQQAGAEVRAGWGLAGSNLAARAAVARSRFGPGLMWGGVADWIESSVDRWTQASACQADRGRSISIERGRRAVTSARSALRQHGKGSGSNGLPRVCRSRQPRMPTTALRALKPEAPSPHHSRPLQKSARACFTSAPRLAIMPSIGSPPTLSISITPTQDRK